MAERAGIELEASNFVPPSYLTRIFDAAVQLAKNIEASYCALFQRLTICYRRKEMVS